MMFLITEQPLEERAVVQELKHSRAGGYVSFEGWVRDHNDGQAVSALEYEAFEALANSEGEKILAEAKAKFEILEAACLHRTGLLKIGEMAVWVGVTAAHRNAAFAACEYIIDEVKHRLPIWKKEYYVNGDSGWVNCQQCAEVGHSHEASTEVTEKEFYARQLCLPEIGEAGQARLKNSRVLVVGAGGLGSPAMQYLAAAGVGTLGICEYDRLEGSNLHRQVLYTAESIGAFKADLAATRLRELNPFVEMVTHREKISPSNVEALFQRYDLVLDCTDNFETKFLLNDAAVLTRTPLIQSSIYQYEGQIQLYQPGENSACLRCLWPETPNAGCVGTCAEVGVLGAVPGVFGTLQALEALKLILRLPGALGGDEMLVMDLLHYEVRKLRRPKNPTCPLCGENPILKEIADTLESDQPVIWEIDARSLLRDPKSFVVIDIREPVEVKATPLLGNDILLMPMSSFSAYDTAFDSEQHYLLVCETGLRSGYLAKILHQQGKTRFYSLVGGKVALASCIADCPV
jgi:sulfur-carrier protein adenylyltransferase/sulfurtransferase